MLGRVLRRLRVGAGLDVLGVLRCSGSRREEEGVVLALGSSRALWRPFAEASRRMVCLRDLKVPDCREEWSHTAVRLQEWGGERPAPLAVLPDPLDFFVESEVRGAFAQEGHLGDLVCRFPEDLRPGRMFSAALLMRDCGMAYQSQATGLFALRCVVHFAVGTALAEEALSLQEAAAAPIEVCPDPEGEAASAECLRVALQSPGDWTGWLRVRDAWNVGKQFRYSDEQIRYHYQHDRSVLR